jgi:hypothetical protein
MVPDFSAVMPVILGFFVLAGVGVLLAVAAVVDLLKDSRRTRLARRESMRTYYGRFVLTH